MFGGGFLRTAGTVRPPFAGVAEAGRDELCVGELLIMMVALVMEVWVNVVTGKNAGRRTGIGYLRAGSPIMGVTVLSGDGTDLVVSIFTETSRILCGGDHATRKGTNVEEPTAHALLEVACCLWARATSFGRGARRDPRAWIYKGKDEVANTRSRTRSVEAK